MTLRDSLLPVIDGIRSIPGALGVRTSTCVRVVRTWSGGSVKLGTSTDSTLTITPSPKVREGMTGNELIVGPITPEMLGAGYTFADLRPSAVDGQEVFWLVTGDNGERRYELVDIDTSRPFRYQLRLRALERTRPF